MRNDIFKGMNAIIYKPIKNSESSNHEPDYLADIEKKFSEYGFNSTITEDEIHIKSLSAKINSTFFAASSNCLITEQYEKLYEHHKRENNSITMVCAIKNVEIPYSTVELDNSGIIQSINNRPRFTFLVETGFYIVEPEAFEVALKEQKTSIKTLVRLCLRAGKKVKTALIPEDCFIDKRAKL